MTDFQPQIDELKAELQKKDEVILELKNKLNELEELLRDHEHAGLGTKRLEDLIKNVAYVDGKEFRADGTQGLTQTITVQKNDTPEYCTITIKGGIITATTC